MAPKVLDETADGSLMDALARPSVQTGLVSIMVSALASHALVWVVTMACAAAWGWIVIHPTWIGITAAVGLCLSVLVPVIWRDSRGGE